MAKSTLGHVPLIQGADINSDSATAQMPLGTYAETNDGRGFRYVKMGATVGVAGRIYQAPAEDTSNFQNIAAAVSAIGDTTVTTTGTVTLTANQLAGGFLTFSTGTTGTGLVYRIKSHPAATGAVVVITLEDPITVATTGTVKIDMHPNPYNGVVITPAGSATSCPVGVSNNIITASQFGWLQTHGPAAVLCSTTITVGNNVMPIFATTAGAATVAVDGVKSSIGYAMTGIATTENGLVHLTID